MAPAPINELERLICLSSLQIDPHQQEAHLDEFTKMASSVAGTKYATINILDSATQWTIAAEGMPAGQIARDETICQFAICNDQPLEIEDLTANPQYNTLGFVKAHPELKYYLGIPLTTEQGYNLGVLCLLDEQTRPVEPGKVEILKMLAKQIVLRLQQKREAEKLKEEITALKLHLLKVAHDIRSPLSGIVGLANHLKTQINGSAGADTHYMLKMLHEGTESLFSFTNDLLVEGKSFFKTQHGQSLSLGQLGNDVVQLYRPQAAAKQIELLIEVNQQKQELQLQRTKLMQVAGNLVSNAIKFTPIGGQVIIELDVLQNDEYPQLEIIVSDNGIGMNEKETEKIEQGSVAGTSPGTVGESGTGLGLQLVRLLLQEMNGTLEVHSTPQFGTTFRVLLPLNATLLQLSEEITIR